jgi:hypothetical protein
MVHCRTGAYSNRPVPGLKPVSNIESLNRRNFFKTSYFLSITDIKCKDVFCRCCALAGDGPNVSLRQLIWCAVFFPTSTQLFQVRGSCLAAHGYHKSPQRDTVCQKALANPALGLLMANPAAIDTVSKYVVYKDL